MSHSALASLTAQYTDSENEEDNDNSQDSNTSQVIIPPPKPATPSDPSTPLSNKKAGNYESTEILDDAKSGLEYTAAAKKTKRNKKGKVRRLVSYQDDAVISDEDDHQQKEDSESESSDELESESEDKETSKKESEDNTNEQTNMEVDNATGEDFEHESAEAKAEKSGKYAHYNFTLPSEPKGKPPADLVEKIKALHDKMRHNNMDMNRIIQGRKEFRNPSIYEKLIQFCDINEFGTNYPPELYDPLQWGPESYYEELARVQKVEMAKRQSSHRKDNDKIEQATALARKVEEEAKRRKSKWDQPAAAKVVPPTLTTTVTGTKGTVISAFGSLPKKPTA